jgi:hypothetical protein
MLHRTGSTPSNDNRAVHAGETIYETSPGRLSRLRQLAGGEGEGGAFGVLVEDPTIDLRAGGSGVKRAWRLASALCLGILLIGATAHAAPRQAQPGTISSQCSGDAFRIDLVELLDVDLGQNADERIEQLRDWIWQILLGRLEATTDLEDLLLGSATQPLVRDDALAHVLDHPVGGTRAVTAKGGEVVVMLEDGDTAEMHDALLDAVDQESLSVGATPGRVVAYRYAIDEREGYAHLCQIGSFDAAWVDAAQQGFRRATVRSASGLASFLDGGVDLLTAQCTDQGLELTGRARPRARKAPITVEHIAALGQQPELSYVPGMSYVPLEALGVSLDELEIEWQGRIAFSASLIREAMVQEMFHGDPESTLDEVTWKAYQQIRAWQQRYPGVAIEEFLLSWIVQSQEQEPGFSLDPKIRAKDLVQSIDELLAVLHDPNELAALLYSWNADPIYALQLLFATVEENREPVRQELLALRDELATSSDWEALGMLSRTANPSDTPERSLLAQVARLLRTGVFSSTPERELLANAAWLLRHRDGYQCARYDGPLQGTLTGMTMFYTDLLMKLWGNDQFGTAPEGLIPGFESIAGHDLPSAYCVEDEQQYTSTRAWLGLRQEQYVRERADQLRFAPVATRVFARSSAYGPEYGEEVEANAMSRRFYQWWNANYARVAAWEPQYELLNQIMKWSVVVQASSLAENGNCMAFLHDVEVNRGHRFDQWVEERQELRWRGPVPLVDRPDEPTECLPILQSRWYPQCGGVTFISGGVTTARRLDVVSKPSWQARIAPQLRRLETAPAVRHANGRTTYASVAKAEGRLHDVVLDPGQRVFTARIDLGTSQRGARHAWITDAVPGGQSVAKVNKSWQLQNGVLAGRATVNDSFGVAHLRVNDITRAVARPQLTRLPAAQVRTIGETTATRLASGKARLHEIAADLPDVRRVWKHDEHTVLVEIADAGGGPSRYVLIGTKGIRGPPSSVVGRFGATGGQPVEVSVVSLSEAPALKQTLHLTEIPTGGPVTKLHAKLESSLLKGDVTKARQLMGEIGAHDPGSHASIRNVIDRARLRALRQGQDPSRFERLLVENRIANARATPLAPESHVVPADGTAFYVPRQHARQYAELATLPVGTNPVTRAGTAPASFHARAIGEASALRHSPRVIQQDGIEYLLVQPSGISAAARLGRVYVVHPCEPDQGDKDDATVSCHGRTSASEGETYTRHVLLSVACRFGDEYARALGVNDCKQLRDDKQVLARTDQ